MAKLVVLYKTPANPAAFDDYYFSKHVPLAKAVPGLTKYEVNAGPIASPAGASPYHLIALLSFGSMESLQQSRGSPQSQAAAADLANFAQAGAELLVFDTKEV